MSEAKPIDLSTVTAKQRKRFYERIDCSGDGCWPWTACVNKSGYGGFGIGNAKAGTQRGIRAHRLAWMLAHPNQILGPEDWVLHKCDTPSCCRPAHLFIGDSLANARDRDSKGRGADSRGEANSSAKLTEREVLEIHRSDELLRILAVRYGVDKQMVSLIQRGRAWGHVVGSRGRKSKRRGDGHCMAKLNAAKVRKIRSSDDILTVLAARYGVSMQLISQVKRGLIWQHVK